MTDTPPTATVAGRSIALHVTGYPDVPNRWGSGYIRVTSLRLDYGSNRTPDARHAFITGLWVRDDGEVTDAPVDQYYDAPTGDMTDWPDWLAGLARKHDPAADRAAVLREAAEQHERLLSDIGADTAKDPRYWTGVQHVITGLRRLADEAQQPETGEPVKPTSHTWTFEVCYDPDADKWHGCGGTYDSSVFDNAHETAKDDFQHRAANDRQRRRFRLVRATTSYTVEAEYDPEQADGEEA